MTLRRIILGLAGLVVPAISQAQMGVTDLSVSLSATSTTTVAYGTPVDFSISVGVVAGGGGSGSNAGVQITCTASGAGTVSMSATTNYSGAATFSTPGSLGIGTWSVTCSGTTSPGYSVVFPSSSVSVTVSSGGTCTSATDTTYIDSDDTPAYIIWEFQIDALPVGSYGSNPPTEQTGGGVGSGFKQYDCKSNDVNYSGSNPPTYEYDSWYPSGYSAVATWIVHSWYWKLGEPCPCPHCVNYRAGSPDLEAPVTVTYTQACI